jgi:hypothetical protein
MSHVPTTRTGVMSAAARPPGSVWRITIVCLVSLLYVASSAAQSIPVIGSLKWYFDGYDAQQEKFPYILSMDHAVNAGFVLLGTNTYSRFAPTGHKLSGELIALDASTGQVIKRDSVCPQFRFQGDAYSLRMASINDSGTVVCYTCYADGVHLATWPDLEPIADTILRGAAHGWMSNTGRYVVLAFGGTLQSWARGVIYDRLTGDTIPAPGYWDGNLGPQFSSDDRSVLLVQGGPSGRWPIIVSLPDGTVTQEDFPNVLGDVEHALSNDGKRVLVTSQGAAVYDAVTGQFVWGLYGGEYPVGRSWLSPDGKDVFVQRSKHLLDSSTNVNSGEYLYRYSIQNGALTGVIKEIEFTPSVGGFWGWLYLFPTMSDGYMAFNYGRTHCARVSYDPTTSVNDEHTITPILYPNPASSSVTMLVGTCTDASHTVTIHDQSGKEVSRRSLPCLNSALTFDVSGMAAGTYVVSVAMPAGAMARTAMLVVR